MSDREPKLTRRAFTLSASLAGVAAKTGLLTASAEAATSASAQVEMSGPAPAPVRLNVNGVERALAIEPRVTLLDALRERLGLTGTKKGCDQGQCGACTVLVDGRRINSCLTLAIAAQGKAVTTIEGVAHGDQLHPVQAAFIEYDAFQCGYCTPGQIMSAVGLLAEHRALDDSAIREQMSGNICRCGAYPNIVDAVRAAGNA